MRLDVFAVDHARDRRDVESRLLGDVLEDHRLEVRLVAAHEVIVLVCEDLGHGPPEGVLALLERLHEPLGGVELLPHEGRGLLLGALRGALRLEEQVGVFLVDAQLRHGEARHREGQLPVMLLQDEVRHDLLRLVRVGVVHLPAGGGVELDDAGHRPLEVLLGQGEPG